MAGVGGRKRLFPQSIDAAVRQSAKKPDAEKPTFTATKKQVEWFEAWRTGKYRFMGIGGGIRGTKTIACLMLLVLLCRIYPRSRWAIVRRDLPTLRRNVVPSMEKVRTWCGGFVGPLKHDTWTYTCANGSQIILFPEQYAQDPELERWKGLEVNGFDAEEGNELNEKTANKMIERAGSWVIPSTKEDPEPNQPAPLVMVNFNPCVEWPRKWFYEPWKNGSMAAPYIFIPATILDNPYASEEYRESLKSLPKAEYDRFVKGEWDFIDDPYQIVKAEWVWAARNVDPVGGAFRIGADIARYGNDASKFYKFRGNQLYSILELERWDLATAQDYLLNLAGEMNAPVLGKNVIVDAVGLGAGIVDFARRKGFPVRELVAGEKPFPRKGQFFKFKNLRSQMWWEGREKLRTGKISLVFSDNKGSVLPLPEKLVGDLCSVRYNIDPSDKCIMVEPKEGIPGSDWGVKARLGRSTDDGDAFMMAIFDYPDRPPRPRLPGSVRLVGQSF